MKKSIIFLIISTWIAPISIQASENDTTYQFETIYENPATPVKDQHRSGTCWDFAGISFIESEIIKKGKGEYDLSEMYIVRRSYPEKARKYVRLHGRTGLTMGGQAHDVTDVINKYGIVTEEVYPGLIEGMEKHNHGELDNVLKAFCKAVVQKKGGEITPVWDNAFEAILDKYLGVVPETFEFDNKTYTPLTFANELEINTDDYIELTSFTNYPFNEKIILEVPDNWSMSGYFNIPLDELIKVMEYALKEGYTIVWDGDVSDKFFSFKDGVAIVPEKDWKDKSEEEKEQTCKRPEPQKEITQEIRQKAFNSQTSTDDHLMHILGLVEDQTGIKYFRTKNSWDDDSNDYGGYLNMSEPYVRLNTIAIMINKDALPPKIARKLGIK